MNKSENNKTKSKEIWKRGMDQKLVADFALLICN